MDKILLQNPYSMIKEQENVIQERELVQGEQLIYDFSGNEKIKQIQDALINEFNKNNLTKKEVQNIILEKNAEKYDIFETDLQPYDWVKIC